MKSIPYRNIGGQIKMKGKISKTLSCGCCVAVNFKKSEQIKEANKEIKEFKRVKDDEPNN